MMKHYNLKYRHIATAFLLVLGSCAPLTKSQIKMSHNYFEAIASQPAHIQELNARVADLNLEAHNLESSLQNSDSLRIATIIYSINEYEAAIRIPDSVAVQIKVLNRYIQNYYLLLPNGFSLYRALKGTTETIGGFFGLGGLVSGILPGNVNGLNPTKKRKIKTHIQESNETVLQACDMLRAYIESVYLPNIEEIDKNSMEDFLSMLTSLNGSTEPLVYYRDHNRMLTEFYQKLYRTRNLASKLSAALGNIVRMQKVIVNSFDSREKVDLEKTPMNDVLNDMRRIAVLLEDLEMIGQNKLN